MTAFIAISAAAIVAALALILPALWGRSGQSSADEQARLKALYKEKLAELEQDLANDELSNAQVKQARRDLESEMLMMLESANAAPQGGSSGPVWMRWLAALAVPLIAFGSYASFVFPTHQQVAAQASAPPLPLAEDGVTPSIPQMVEQLKARLAQAPNDIQGWTLLGRSMSVLGRHAEAAEAYERAVALSAFRDADLVVAYAESLAFAAGREIDNRILSLIKDALKIDPAQPKALWLAGWAHFQRKDYDAAINYWQTLDERVKPDSELKKLVRSHIAEARKAGGSSAQLQGDATQDSVADVALDVHVTLAEDLRSEVSPDDTVFVFARVVDGLRPPLALVRKTVSDLPFTVRLDDSQAMIPTNKLSSADEVRVTARVSKSGQAKASPGDLQGQIERVHLGTTQQVAVNIDYQLP